jgi:asparagine synthase (glutamine-hydrolysing)
MSLIFGRWDFESQSVSPQYLDAVREIATAYAPDGASVYSRNGLLGLFCALHTTKESLEERQPFVTCSGAVITWDGRLDNRLDISRACGLKTTEDTPDVLLVAAAYEKYGIDCFGKFVGEWALAIWHQRDGVLLARDILGIRPLCYLIEQGCVTWSTILDPLALLAKKSFNLDEEYVAGWFSFFPASHLTPYSGIYSVPPSSFVRIRKTGSEAVRYWDFDAAKNIHYSSDAEYEEHFRNLFKESVKRRLRSNGPVLAELSGGMDSSAIVSVADSVIAEGGGEGPLLGTVSFYNDAEANWDERSYFNKVEEKRGRAGFHINVSDDELVQISPERERFPSAPGDPGRQVSRSAIALASFIASSGSRILLSGIGGDEVTGGVPSPEPELADLLLRGQLRPFTRALKAWALAKRKPWFQLLFHSLSPFLPAHLSVTSERLTPALWLNDWLLKENRAAFAGYRSRLKVFGPRPSFQENVNALDGLRRQFGCSGLPSLPPYEKRYPFLDRDLLEFLYALPRSQVLRPGERRSLLRRALRGIVPNEILDRKRKAYVVRSPMAAIAARWKFLAATRKEMLSSAFGFIDQLKFMKAIEHLHQQQDPPLVFLLRTLAFEFWLRDVESRGVVNAPQGSPIRRWGTHHTDTIRARRVQLAGCETETK